MDSAGWIAIFTTQHLYQAELVCQTLLEADIDAVIINQQDSIYPAIGQIEVHIKQTAVIPAKHILETMEL